MAVKKVLVTGGAGFIGSFIVDALIEQVMSPLNTPKDAKEEKERIMTFFAYFRVFSGLYPNILPLRCLAAFCEKFLALFFRVISRV